MYRIDSKQTIDCIT